MSPRNELLSEIHAKGYWRVVIRPTIFQREVISSLSECRSIVQASQVSLRGWPYPVINQKLGIVSGQDWVESKIDWAFSLPPGISGRYIEYWRFFQSAQFVHHYACTEDYEFNGERPRFLRPLSTLYTLTEIFEFAGRLAEKDILLSSAEILIELHGMNNRVLLEPDKPMFLAYGVFRANIDKISFRLEVSADDLIGTRYEMARAAMFHIFERFNWNEIPKTLFAEDQRKLLERRL